MPSDAAPRFRSIALLAGLSLVPALAWPSAAPRAQLRTLTVPAEAGVAVAARGQAQPKLIAPPQAYRATELEEEPAPVQLAPGGTGLAAPLGLALPLAAAALLGTGMSQGGSSGGSGPVRTR